MENAKKQQIYIEDFDDSQISSTGESFSYSQISVNKSVFIKEEVSNIEDYYEIYKTPIGQGGYGKVYKAKHKASGEIRAVKRISNKNISKFERFKCEVMALKALDHPNIVKLYEVYYDHRSVFLVMEMCTGGDLMSRTGDKNVYNEEEAAEIFQQIIASIRYCHK